MSCLFIRLYKRITKGRVFFVLFVCFKLFLFLLSGANTANILQ